jgi:hypothetical protein
MATTTNWLPLTAALHDIAQLSSIIDSCDRGVKMPRISEEDPQFRRIHASTRITIEMDRALLDSCTASSLKPPLDSGMDSNLHETYRLHTCEVWHLALSYFLLCYQHLLNDKEIHHCCYSCCRRLPIYTATSQVDSHTDSSSLKHKLSECRLFLDDLP